MILDVSHISFSYGSDVILRDITFRVNADDRVAVVGYNGCGKTTLMDILTGVKEPASGTVALNRHATLGYLEQTSGLNAQNSLYAEMKSAGGADQLLSRMKKLERCMGDDPEMLEEYERVSAKYEALDGYNLDFNIKKILSGMSFPVESFEKSVSVLSGGERTRLALAKLLIMNPDLLLLDEPTNHLDIDTLEWLERFLSSYNGAVIMVSHDRIFLDRTTNRTLEIQNGKSKMYSGNYTTFLQQKQEAEIKERNDYERNVEKADKLREYAERNIVRASTTKMAQSRLKMIERLDLTAPENANHVVVKFRIESQGEPYKDVIVAKDLRIEAGGRLLIDHLSFVLERSQRLVIVGSNGTGKTTLLRAIIGRTAPKSGRLRLGGGLKMSHLDQNVFGISAENPIQFIWDLYPSMNQLAIRNLLASVGFRGEDVFKPVSGLSGGELARLSLARISLEHPNLLILDEPTNHLDIYTKDILCEALRTYEGTMVVVTHDRYLIEILGARILCIKDQKGIFYKNYTDFRDDIPEVMVDESLVESTGSAPVRRTDPLPEFKKVPSSKDQRRERAQEREHRINLEKKIEELENDIAFLESELQKPEVASDFEKVSEYGSMMISQKQELNILTDEWLENYSD